LNYPAPLPPENLTNIKSNKGSMTPGTMQQTADSIDLDRLEKLSIKLKNNTYKFPQIS
jgi:hypothetical protein